MSLHFFPESRVDSSSSSSASSSKSSRIRRRSSRRASASSRAPSISGPIGTGEGTACSFLSNTTSPLPAPERIPSSSRSSSTQISFRRRCSRCDTNATIANSPRELKPALTSYEASRTMGLRTTASMLAASFGSPSSTPSKRSRDIKAYASSNARADVANPPNRRPTAICRRPCFTTCTTSPFTRQRLPPRSSVGTATRHS
mmetsp:Transcript_11734/g.25380  ORF Transcript_11734/g.25380 Transcript_11734/m.25380 type:complete len:201 (+) Transcript_11734:1927-2529(+)